MTEEMRLLEKAMTHFWDTFLRSQLSETAQLNKNKLTYTGRTWLNDWDGTGDFYGGSIVELKRADGVKFLWSVGLFFEQGEDEQRYWQQGCANACMSLSPNDEAGRIAFYDIGVAQLPNTPLTMSDIPDLAESTMILSKKTFQDLESVFQLQQFDELVSLLPLRKQSQLPSNPLKENYHDFT